MFKANRVLFRTTNFFRITQCRSMENDFGILPMPKFDESQAEYYHPMSYSSPAICIPYTAENPEINGAVIEALSYYGRTIMLPAYYDRLLMGIVSRDEESKFCLDIIFDSVNFDLGTIYNFGGLRECFTQIISSGANMFASYYEKNEAKAKKELDNYINSYKDYIN
ncbi:hypothetical protein SDC9_194561 [bioreactor metagenome]|uniref:Uncharacterized protein n=1 Tax=bioreactor metagenome TaxID=1076179 RepID=A0A645I844_9ZZZZ